MLSMMAGWGLALTVVLGLAAVVFWRHGPRAALGVGMLLSFAVPVWLRPEIGGLPIDVRTATAIILLLLYTFHRDGRLFTPLTWIDLSIVGIVLLHVTTDSVRDGFSLAIPVRAYGEWALPYAAGRYAVRDSEDAARLAPWALGIVAVLGVLAMVEMLSGFNPWEVVFGVRPEDGANRDASRFGLKRAYGPEMHSIFCGMMMSLLIPWCGIVVSLARERTAKVWALLAAGVGCLGVLSTLSRGPLLIVILTWVFVGMIWVRWLRWSVGVVAMVLVGCLVIAPEQVINAVDLTVPDKGYRKIVELDGEMVMHSGTRNRLLLIKAYTPALKHAGFIGYGTEATSGFPPNIPYLPENARSVEVLRIVDNSYVLFGLRFGWLGMALLVMLIGCAIWTGVKLTNDRTLSSLTGPLAGVIAATSLMMLTVFMSNGFQIPLLWTCGILSGLATHRSRGSLGSFS